VYLLQAPVDRLPMHASQRRQVQVGEVVTVSRLATKPNLDNMPFALRALADRIDAGKEPGLDRVVVILNGDDLAFEHYGKPCNIAELVGLMEFTKSLLLYPEE